MLPLKNKFKKSKYNLIIQSLKNSSSRSIGKQSQEKAIKAYNKIASLESPYRKMLHLSGVEGKAINNIELFKKYVPVTDKDNIFSQENTDHIFSPKNLPNIQNILLSSGSSGSFSYGISSERQQKRNAQFLDILLHYFYKTLENNTLLINCLTQAVNLPNITGATTVEIGPRTDSLIFILKTLSKKFDQTIILSDNYFIKNSLEDCLNENIDLAHIKIHLVLGGTYLPENLRSHLEALLNIDPTNKETGSVLSSMGISEFGLNLFFESEETVRIRRLAKSNPEFKKKLLGDESPFLPMFFNFFPQTFYIEEFNNEILITDLSHMSKFPLIRYNSKDKGKIIPFDHINDLLKDFGIEDSSPPFQSPLALIYGRDKPVDHKRTKIFPAQIQEGLFSHFEVASKTTGNFRLSPSKYSVELKIQLKKGVVIDRKIKKLFANNIYEQIKTNIPLSLYSYQDFPYGMDLDYQKKFRYID